MTEIQQAFEKWATTKHKYDVERWPDNWDKGESVTGEPRYYKSLTADCDFHIFKAGWEARGKV